MENNKPEERPFTPEDIGMAVSLIDEAANNGTFKGWESQQRALHVRERLYAFGVGWQRKINDDHATRMAAEQAEQAQAEESANNKKTIKGN